MVTSTQVALVHLRPWHHNGTNPAAVPRVDALVAKNGVSTWNNIQEFVFWYNQSSFWIAYVPSLLLTGVLPNLPKDNATLFLPTNQAWQTFLTAQGLTLQQFVASPQLLPIMKYHVVTGRTLAPCSSAQADVALPTADVPNQLMPQPGRWV